MQPREDEMRVKKTATTNVIKQWMQVATVEEQEALARIAETSRAYLYQCSSGKRWPSAELGQKLAAASARLAREGLDALQLEDFIDAGLLKAIRAGKK